MTFAKIDVGDGKRTPEAKGRDCTVRALCVAANISYESAWTMLYSHQGIEKTNAFDLDGLLNKELLWRGKLQEGEWGVYKVKTALSFPAVKGKPRMTPAAFVKAHPTGRFVLSLAHHVVAVRDGVVIDTWDCTKKCVYKAWEIELPGDKT